MLGIKFIRSGKVRDLYAVGDSLLIVSSDRVSAFDVILPTELDGKGKILNSISLFWFNMMESIIPNHIVESDVNKFPVYFDYKSDREGYTEKFSGRSVLVRKSKVIPFECIVRGYLSGSAWEKYQSDYTVGGEYIAGLKNSSKLPYPIFTPSTKEESGHDVNVDFDFMADVLGTEQANYIREKSLAIYTKAADYALSKGIIIADTKMEFGVVGDSIILIDELLTPDSSRFWDVNTYKVGEQQDSFDKQIIRDYLLTLDWDKTNNNVPSLPKDIYNKALARYQEIHDRLTK